MFQEFSYNSGTGNTASFVNIYLESKNLLKCQFRFEVDNTCLVCVYRMNDIVRLTFQQNFAQLLYDYTKVALSR